MGPTLPSKLDVLVRMRGWDTAFQQLTPAITDPTTTGLPVLMPERREEVLGLVWKALFAGSLATLMTACIVGAMPASVFGQ